MENSINIDINHKNGIFPQIIVEYNGVKYNCSINSISITNSTSRYNECDIKITGYELFNNNKVQDFELGV